jgi:hypothetical protein
VTRFAPVCLLLVSAAWAQDNPPPDSAKSAPPSEDAIAAARREFNTVKALRSGLEAPRSELPAISTPELHTAPAMPRMEPATKLDPKAAGKSANWLVDAMMKPDETHARDPRRTVSDPARRDRESGGPLTLDAPAGAETGTTATREATAPVAEKRVGPEFNPLNRYMAGWMTAQDYALLKPGSEGAGSSSLSTRGDPSLPAIGADLSVLGDTGSALDLTAANSTPGAAFALPKPNENPFLQSLTLTPMPEPAGLSAPSAPTSTSASVLVAPVPADAGPVRSKIPDFAKPATDKKFFKQLKRF